MIVMHPTTLSTMMAAASSFSAPRLILYQGAMPTVDNNFVYTVAAYTSQAVIAVQTVTIQTINSNLSFTATPTNANATATAEITWFALFDNSNPSVAIIGSVGSQANGTAPLLVVSTSAVTGQPVAFTQLSIFLS